MHSNSDNLRSLPTQKTKNKTHFHTYTKQNKTKRLLSKSIDNATQHYDLSNGGLRDALVCYMSNMVGGGKNLRNQYYNGEVLHPRRFQMVF
jgi:hypothetical protein